MLNDYECPRCHNKFPSSNKFLHDLKYTESKPAELNASRINFQNKNEVIPPKTEEKPGFVSCSTCHQSISQNEYLSHLNDHNSNNLEELSKITEESKNMIENELTKIQKNLDNLILYQKNKERNKYLKNLNIPRKNRRIQRDNGHNNNHQSHEENDFIDINQGINISNGLNIDFSSRDDINIGNRHRRNNHNHNRDNPHHIRRYKNVFDNGINVRIENEIIIGPSDDSDNDSDSDYQNNNRNNRNNNRFDYRHNIMNNRNYSGNHNRNNNNNRNYNRYNYFNRLNRNNFQNAHHNATTNQIVNGLPETKIEDITKLDQEKKNCVICLEDFKNGDTVINLPCIHLFHNKCIKNWLKNKNSCPICKFELRAENVF